VSVLVYGVTFTCDLCGATAGTDARLPASPPPVYGTEPVPDGWSNLELMSLAFKDLYGARISHLCKNCSALSIGELAAKLRAQYEAKVAAHGNGN
jgi:hypothetical protein